MRRRCYGGTPEPTRYTHSQLATMIGSERETATRAFTLLQQAGVVDSKRRRIRIKDMETLERVLARRELSKALTVC